MRFEETALRGAFVIHQERHVDERGFFARTWSREEFAAHDLATEIVHVNTSFNRTRGTLRGMHWQVPPFAEAKVVRCTAGAIYDVMVDLRSQSPTYTRHVGVTLSADEGTMVYCPPGFAHGFITLTDATEVSYLMTQAYAPDHARGARWDDQLFDISWPMDPVVISDRDRTYPDLRP